MKYPKTCIAIVLFIVFNLLPYANILAFDRHKLAVSISGDRSNCNIVKDYESRVIPPYLPRIDNSRHNPHPGIYGLTGSLAYRISKSVSLNWLVFYSQKITVYRNFYYIMPESRDNGDRSSGDLDTFSRLSGSGLGISIRPQIYKIHPVLSFSLLLCRVNTYVQYNGTVLDHSGNQSNVDINIDNKITDLGYLSSLSLGVPFKLLGNYSLTPFIGYRYSDKISIVNEDYGILTRFKLDYSSLWSGLNINYRIQ
jgi:hypothetical protein